MNLDQPNDQPTTQADAELTAVRAKRATKKAKEKLPRKAPPEVFEAYYNSARKEFLTRNSGGRWLSHNENSFKRLLRSKGYRLKPNEGDNISEVEAAMLQLMNEKDVKFTGSLAGRDAGFFDENGIRFLVTDSPQLLSPQAGVFPLLTAILHGLFCASDLEHGPMQLAIFQGWMAAAVQSHYEKKPRPVKPLPSQARPDAERVSCRIKSSRR